MKLVEETSAILRKATDPWDFSNPPTDPVALVRDMWDVMMTNRGVGLAAPQVGLPYRVFVMGDSSGYREACFNPEIINQSEVCLSGDEGCLSFPNLSLTIPRPIFIDVRFFNEKGEMVVKRLDKLWARCYQHELDHLNGVVFVDRISRLKLQMAMNKRNKMKRKAV